MEVWNKFRVTLMAALAGTVMLGVLFFTHRGFSGSLIDLLQWLDAHHLAEVTLLTLLIGLGVAVDLFAIKKSREQVTAVREHRHRVLKATMRTVHDVVNNFLNNVQLFRLEASDKNVLEPESLQMLDTAIVETAVKLKQMGDLEAVIEKEGPGGLHQIVFQIEQSDKESIESRTMSGTYFGDQKKSRSGSYPKN